MQLNPPTLASRPAVRLFQVARLSHAIEQYFLKQPVKTVKAIFGAMTDKNIEGILKEFGFVEEWLLCGLESERAESASKLAESLDYVGVLAVEFFQMGQTLLVNEIAPRVHNSGHWSIEGAATSQFENHIRAICGLPLGDTATVAPRVEMRNIVGKGAKAAHDMLAEPNLHLHLYGKKQARDGRKMGHATKLGWDS